MRTRFLRCPTLDKLAAAGLKHNRFHITALCSPTRAARRPMGEPRTVWSLTAGSFG